MCGSLGPQQVHTRASYMSLKQKSDLTKRLELSIEASFCFSFLSFMFMKCSHTALGYVQISVEVETFLTCAGTSVLNNLWWCVELLPLFLLSIRSSLTSCGRFARRKCQRAKTKTDRAARRRKSTAAYFNPKVTTACENQKTA